MKTARQLVYSRGPADRDPMFTAIWYTSLEPLQRVDAPVQAELPFQAYASQADTIIDLPPSDNVKWLAVIGRANEVTETLRKDADFSGDVLVGVVRELVDLDPSVDVIIDTYRRRMAKPEDM